MVILLFMVRVKGPFWKLTQGSQKAGMYPGQVVGIVDYIYVQKNGLIHTFLSAPHR